MKNADIDELESERRDMIRWLKLYQTTVAGLAAFAEMYAESCTSEWLAMMYSLQELADTMRVEIEEREKEANDEEH